MAILADDLIWGSRLAGLVRDAGAEVAPIRSLAALEERLAEVDAAIVDLTARAYDGAAAIAVAAGAGLPVIAVGQHDDRPTRDRALAAGAGQVYAYRRLFEDGPRQVATWLASIQVAQARR